jgi:endo-1,4-beta-D-glucanase Y
MLRSFLCFLLLVAGTSSAALLDVPNARPKVSKDWTPALDLVWQGIKARNIQPWTTGLVHRPKSETPGDAVSEGQGYGMMVALFAGDQTTFNSIWAATEKFMWNGSCLVWRRNSTGGNSGDGGAATDADQDVAAMLILADSLVKAKVWTGYSLPNGGPTYAVRAQTMLNTIWGTMVEQRNGEYHLRPGDGWGGYGSLNPGYYTPAFYRIYKDFDSNAGHNWMALIDQAYRTLEAADVNDLGLTPDWCNGAGALLPSGPGYNAFDQGHSMYKDAIRTLWRIGTDAIWFNEPRAKSFLTKSANFLLSKGGASTANFYQMDGQLVDANAQFVFNGGALTRPRREHSPLTIAMWAAGAMGAENMTLAESLSVEMGKYYTPGANYFGRATDAAGEDTLHNEDYFDQFLAWWGVSLMAGAYSDIRYDIANPPPPPLATHKLNKANADNDLFVSWSGRTLQVRCNLLNQPGATLYVTDLRGHRLQMNSLPQSGIIAIEVRSGKERVSRLVRIN